MFTKRPRTPHQAIEEGFELDASGEDSARRHAANCPECAAKLEADDLVTVFLKLPPPALAPGFVTRTCARAVGGGTTTAPLWWVSLPLSWRLGLAALFVLAALGGYGVGSKAARTRHDVIAAPACCALPELAAMRAERVPASLGGGK
jgi:anti-sigma factor RsiW